MGVEIVQNHVQLFAGIFGNQLIHEIQELTSAPATIMSGMHQPRSHLQSCEERGGAVALVFVSKTSQCATVGQADPALCPLQSLNAGLFIYTEHQRVLRRVQVKPDDIGSLAAELRISAHTPALPTLKMQVMFSHDPPDLSLAHIAQMLGKQPPIPATVARGAGSSSAFKMRFSLRAVYLRRFSAERTLSS